ncbi:MAG: class I SAM-dependent methyltransferase [Verrucomicrobia bacterium]|nr:class I SAM-dependent methyltransferase [Verrucomicrobiota bacterium]
MQRIPEPELMSDDEQALAYAQADFDSAHSRYPILFARLFPNRPRRALVLDIGCGPCDVTRRFAKANPGYRFHAVDGSPAMLKQAKRHPRIKLICGFVPNVKLPAHPYDLIVSSSLLHHLHDPQFLWQTVRRYSRPGTMVFVVDLRRPATRAAARAIVRKYSAGEPAVLQRDFFNSLLASFTVPDVRQQLREAGLHCLGVRTISDRHLMVAGQVPSQSRVPSGQPRRRRRASK